MSKTRSDDELPDLYAPWRQSALARQRHVGRAEELEAILSLGQSFATGKRPLPVYVFGPRGIGKSHLLTMVHAGLRKAYPDLVVDVVPEDIPEHRSAKKLVARIESGGPAHRWARGARREKPRVGRRVVLLEGLDRQLRALGTQQRRELRRLLAERRGWWIVGTGVTLPIELTGRDEAFYGAFDHWPLAPLDETDSSNLLDVVSEADSEDPTWQGRRETLVTLAGGSARALVALAVACRNNPEGWASAQLSRVVHDFTSHYQLRYRDLPPQQQQIVELLATAPRELTPTDLGEMLETTSSQASVQARRLVLDGVLRERSEGRRTWYALHEPLFRFWLEYRTAPWEETLAGWLSRLLEVVLSPAELTATWLEHPEEAMRRAAADAIKGDTEAQAHAWRALLRRFWRQGTADDLQQVCELPPHPTYTRLVVFEVIGRGEWPDADSSSLQEYLAKHGSALGDLVALVSFDRTLRAQSVAPRRAFAKFVSAIRGILGARERMMQQLGFAWMRPAFLRVLRRSRRGAPWKLTARERNTLARTPGLRSVFLTGGRTRSQPPLLAPEDVLQNPEAIGMDADDLLAAAAIRGSSALVVAAAASVSPRELRQSPRPAARFDEEASNAIAAILAGPADDGEVDSAHVTWSAALTDCGDEQFSAVVSSTSRVGSPGQSTEAAQLALATLATWRPDRFEAFREALDESWDIVTEEADRLVTLMRERTHGRLHPELERIRQELIGDAELP